MNDPHDTVDRLLRDYAPRWRAAQPPPPTVDISRLPAGRRRRPRSARRFTGHAARWAPVAAVGAAVALLATGVAFVRDTAAPPRPPTTSPSPSLPAGIVPWLPLEATGVELPTRTLASSPDPAEAEGLSPCRADQLQVEASSEGAGGTRFLDLTFRATGATTCRLGGRPTVTVLGKGKPLPVPVEAGSYGEEYAYPVAVTRDQPATLFLGWASNWCATPVDNDALRLALPDGGGTLTTVGFGRSACYGEAGSGTRAPIRVGTFRPAGEFTGERLVTVFDGVSAAATVTDGAAAGGRLRFTVVLTAPAGRDVPLDPCPDYTVNLYLGERQSTTVSYALNCAGVPHRDGTGRAYLPAGGSVRFAMEVVVPVGVPEGAKPGVPDNAKLTWSLNVPDPVAAGATVTIR